MEKVRKVKKLRRTKNKDNRGMSLVEVIVAITILGLVSVPVLHSMTTAMVYNAKARNRQDLTLKAESIMESFKGYSLETLCGYFTDGTGLAGIDGTYSCQYNGTEIDGNTDLDSIPVDAAYTFTIADMTVNGQDYTVEVTAAPHVLDTVLEPEDVSETRDAVFYADRAWDTGALDSAKTHFASTEKDAAVAMLVSYFEDKKSEDREIEKVFAEYNNVEIDLTDPNDVDTYLFNDTYSGVYVGDYIRLCNRHLNFCVEKTAGGNYVVTAEVVYDYCFSGYPYYVRMKSSRETNQDEYLEEDESEEADYDDRDIESRTSGRFPSDDEDNVYSVPIKETEIYSGSAAAGLDRLYLYYYPQYSFYETGRTGADCIQITFDSTVDDVDTFQCYILKQRAAEISETKTTTQESSYYPKVAIENNSSAEIWLIHNLEENIGDSGGTSPGADFSRVPDSCSIYSYTDLAASALSVQETLSYTVKLVATNNNTGAEATTLTSTMIETID